jgi:hypothetical protein
VGSGKSNLAEGSTLQLGSNVHSRLILFDILIPWAASVADIPLTKAILFSSFCHKVLNNMSGRGALVIPAVKRHTATVIMAHGLGDSGAGWVTLAENWRRRSKFEEVKFIFPNAPNIPITVVSSIGRC